MSKSATLTKIVRKSWEKDRKSSPIFSKGEYFCQNSRIIQNIIGFNQYVLMIDLIGMFTLKCVGFI